jgi:fibronectin-binding autotransporter adhesin
VNGTVTLGTNGILVMTSLGYVPTHGTQFTIIKNDSGSPVTGTFSGLPEGATFVAESTTFQISYIGGSGHDVVLTAISPWVPTTLAVDPDGNGVLEAGELATVQPTWMNSSGSSSTLTDATTNFTGPAGPTYSNPDASGSYGTLADGTSAQCTDCYTVQVSGTRPAQHWDATIDETVTPTSTVETWKLHVGESFPDVPTSQQFYKYIENLFHNGVTGGCAGGNYCRTIPSREPRWQSSF